MLHPLREQDQELEIFEVLVHESVAVLSRSLGHLLFVLSLEAHLRPVWRARVQVSQPAGALASSSEAGAVQMCSANNC